PIGPDDQDVQDEHRPLSEVYSLPLDLTLRCGELRLTLAEVRRLDAGTVLEVIGIAPGYATLCHGVRVVADGELVDVD
ncbi:FliM/FliN family flagellar motor switch protein, partial [Pseudomonas syringae group genomosp. 7]|uniref:FliM/FliN family flagellar motor switch protein n=1 Tax=Pseudomonas syringae group genomosp. 7 TaxID=251699 RepID=UPI0037700843